MNEETTNLANQALKLMVESATEVKDFTLEQAPDVINQLLLWKFYENLIWGLVAIITSLIVIGLWVAIIKYYKEMLRKDLEWLIVPFGILSFFQLFFGFAGMQCLSNAVKIYIAPKVYLLEYAASLI